MVSTEDFESFNLGSIPSKTGKKKKGWIVVPNNNYTGYNYYSLHHHYIIIITSSSLILPYKSSELSLIFFKLSLNFFKFF